MEVCYTVLKIHYSSTFLPIVHLHFSGETLLTLLHSYFTSKVYPRLTTSIGLWCSLSWDHEGIMVTCPFHTILISKEPLVVYLVSLKIFLTDGRALILIVFIFYIRSLSAIDNLSWHMVYSIVKASWWHVHPMIFYSPRSRWSSTLSPWKYFKSTFILRTDWARPVAQVILFFTS